MQNGNSYKYVFYLYSIYSMLQVYDYLYVYRSISMYNLVYITVYMLCLFVWIDSMLHMCYFIFSIQSFMCMCVCACCP
jgi:hypothetical protein